MSKMSQLHAELSEQANELGFETIQDAVNSGYVVDYDNSKLVKYGLGYSETVECLTKEQEKAHEAWLEEREEVFEMIDNMERDIIDSVDKKEGHPRYWVDTLERIRAFVEKGEM